LKTHDGSQPVAGARVSLRTKKGWLYHTQSDHLGRVLLDAPAGDYRLFVQARGHRQLERAASLPTTATSFRLERAFTLSGTVEGDGAARCVVQFRRVGKARLEELTVDKTGRFASASLSAGRYDVIARSKNAPFVASRWRGAFAVPPKQPLVLKVEPAHVLRGVVKLDSASGKAIAGAAVGLRPLATTLPLEMQKSAADGSFRFLALKKGRYLLQAWSQKHLPMFARVRLPLAADKPLVVVLSAGHELFGVVTAAGAPVVGALVRAVTQQAVGGVGELGVVPGPVPPIPPPGSLVSMQAGARLLWSARTDRRGAFRLAGLPGGAVSIRVDHPRYARYESARIDPKSQREKMDIQLQAARAISGLIVDHRGTPIAKARVRAFEISGGTASKRKKGRAAVKPAGFSSSARSDANGLFRLERVSERVLLKVEATGYLPLEQQATSSIGQPKMLHIALQRASVCRIEVRDHRTGAGITRYGLRIDAQKPVLISSRRKQRHVLSLRAGKHVLEISAAGYARKRVTIAAPDPNRTYHPLDVVVELHAAGEIEGSVRDAFGRAIKNAEVRAGGAKALTDERGTFLLEAVAEGLSVVVLRHRGKTYKSDPVTVRSGQRSGPVRFHLR
jgi:hypothetical protein